MSLCRKTSDDVPSSFLNRSWSLGGGSCTFCNVITSEKTRSDVVDSFPRSEGGCSDVVPDEIFARASPWEPFSGSESPRGNGGDWGVLLEPRGGVADVIVPGRDDEGSSTGGLDPVWLELREEVAGVYTEPREGVADASSEPREGVTGVPTEPREGVLSLSGTFDLSGASILLR